MVIQHNLAAINSHRNLGINNGTVGKNLEKLSSGYRINRAGDDAAGLAISEKMRGQIRGLAMAETNSSNGISLINTAEGGLNETHAILHRMRELAVQSSNGTYVDDDREQIAKEAQALKSELDRIATSTHYNGIKLLDGTVGGSKITATGTEVKDILGDNLVVGTIDASVDATAPGTLSVIKTGDAATPSYTFSMQVGDKTYTSEIIDGATDISGAAVSLYLDGDSAKNPTAGMTIATTVGANLDTMLKGGSVSNIDLSGAGALQAIAVDGMVASESSELIFQIGANGGADQKVGLHVANMSSGAIGNFEKSAYNINGTVAGISVATREDSNDAIKVIDSAISYVSGQRAELGALQNRLEHTLNNLGVTKENLTAAESSIRDVDMAKEMMEFTKNNILVQASQSMLAQANALPQGVLSLLK